jgi:hypothetical protein
LNQFESFFKPEPPKPEPTPPAKQPIPNHILGDVLAQNYDLRNGTEYELEMRKACASIKFLLFWSQEKENVWIDKIQIQPAKGIGRNARVLAKYVDWGNQQLFDLAVQRIQKSLEFKNYQKKVKAFCDRIASLEATYQFNFEKEIANDSRK